MADLTANQYIRTRGEPVIEYFTIDTSVARTFFKGQPVMIDQNVDTLNVAEFDSTVTLASGDVIVGVAAAGKVVAAGDSQEITVPVYVGPSIVGFPSAVFTTADIGKTIYKDDSAVLTATANTNATLGKLVKVEDGFAYIELATPAVITVS